MDLSTDRRKMFYWALYDWAVTPFNTVIVTFIFSAYFISHVANSSVHGTAMLGYINSIAAFLVAVLSVTLGQMVDKTGGHKRWIGAFSIVVVIAATALYFTHPVHADLAWALIWFGIGLFAAEITNVFYNAMLAKCFPARVTGILSGWGWGMSFLGGLCCLFVMLLIDQNAKHWFPASMQGSIVARLSGPVVAVWLIVFSLPFFISCRDVKKSAKKHASLSIKNLIQDMKDYPRVAFFLLARMFYMDGLNTTLAFGSIYAVGVFKIKLLTVLYFGISINLIAGIGAIFFGWVEKSTGPKKMVQFGLFSMLVAVVAMISSPNFHWFWGFAVIYGLALGPIQSSSRSLLCQICPKEKITEMFGFYSLSGRITTFLGPLALAFFTEAFNSQKAGMISALGWMVIGWVMLFWLRVSPRTLNKRIN